MTTRTGGEVERTRGTCQGDAVQKIVLVDGEEWKLVGSGLTFEVFANDTKVLKVPLSVEQLAEQLASHGADSSLAASRRCYDASLARLSVLRRKINGGQLPTSLFARPEIQRDGRVYQPRVTPLLDALQTASRAVGRDLVDGALEVIADLVSWGVFASYVSLPVDFGVDRGGRVTAIGFGGLVFDQESAFKAMATRPWQRAVSGAHMLPTHVHQYFVSRAGARLTPQLIGERWGTAR